MCLHFLNFFYVQMNGISDIPKQNTTEKVSVKIIIHYRSVIHTLYVMINSNTYVLIYIFLSSYWIYFLINIFDLFIFCIVIIAGNSQCFHYFRDGNHHISMEFIMSECFSDIFFFTAFDVLVNQIDNYLYRYCSSVII